VVMERKGEMEGRSTRPGALKLSGILVSVFGDNPEVFQGEMKGYLNVSGCAKGA